jgi:hypothetical protein
MCSLSIRVCSACAVSLRSRCDGPLIDEAAWCSLGKAGVAAGSVLLLPALALRARFDRLGSSASISAQSGKYSQVLIRGTNGERVSSCIITISEELGSDFVVLGSQLTREQQVRMRSARVHCLRTDRCRDAMTVLLLLLRRRLLRLLRLLARTVSTERSCCTGHRHHRRCVYTCPARMPAFGRYYVYLSVEVPPLCQLVTCTLL